MTDLAGALSVLASTAPDSGATADALAAFEARFRDDHLVMDKWFSIQASMPGEGAVERVRALMDHPGFHLDNPNRLRALIGVWATGNQTGFHRADGTGYAFFAKVILKAAALNPQVAARLATALRSWRSLEPVRRDHARSALVTISEAPDLPVDVRDIVERTLR